MPNKKIKILSFDPGLTKAGWSFSEYDTTSRIYTVIKFGTITPNTTAAKALNRDAVNIFGKRVIALRILREAVDLLVKQYKPDFIATEDAFYNPRTPNAYGSLLTWIVTVENFMYSEFKMPIYRIAPKLAKHNISGDGTSGKLSVQDAVVNHSNIKFRANLPVLDMCEHEADSIAIGWSFVYSILPNLTFSCN